MFELLSLISIVLAIVGLSTARGVRARLETEIAALKLELKRVEGMRPAASDSSADETAAWPETVPETSSESVDMAAMEAAPEQVTEDVPEPAAAMADAAEPVQAVAAEQVKPVVAEPAKPAVAKPSWESRIAAQWTVWVGGIALAFAGIFAIKYSIDQGFFSPAVRLSAAALFGLLLVAGGEFLRRRAQPLVDNAFQNAMIPGVLTAAGTLTLFGSVYVAHGFYGFFGPATAFILLALISFMTIGLSMLYGQALAGLGLLASFTTPLLVASNSPRPWALFGFLTLVWIATTLASKIQSWRVVPAIANVGLSVWAFLYLVSSRPETPFEVMPVLLPMIIMIAGLAFIWPGNWVAAVEPEPQEEEVQVRLDWLAARCLPQRRA